MRILISNDDGFFAPGIAALYQALKDSADITVVAPESDRSGYSSALTLDRPLRAIQQQNGFWSVNGTPADCVYAALNGLVNHSFDLVISGINSGANLGDDVLYSGTVGAAREGRLMQLPAIAVSLAGQGVSNLTQQSYMSAALWLKDFIAQLPSLPDREILNINIPYTTHIKGIQWTKMGQRKKPLPIQSIKDPRGRDVFWVGLAGDFEIRNDHNDENNCMSDFEAVNQCFVSITPLHIDSTSYHSLNVLQNSQPNILK